MLQTVTIKIENKNWYSKSCFILFYKFIFYIPPLRIQRDMIENTFSVSVFKLKVYKLAE